MSFVVIIPARLHSTRLPRKPLQLIHGQPMIYWTWRQAQKSGAQRIIIATESTEVAAVCREFGAEVCLTSEQHQSGTERIAEVIALSLLAPEQIIVNLQGDEPLLPPQLIHQVAQGLEIHPDVPMATLCEPITDCATLFDPNAVKVSRNAEQMALTFSRAPLPWARDEFAERRDLLPKADLFRRHIGLYAYRAGFVTRYVAWPPCALEQLEKLEQLRVLWHGEKILVLDALMEAGGGVDTLEDLERVRLAQKPSEG
ncbi:MAG: 3-deoxy-manno-octulosonate cytidylyltransferase [Thiotrichales bacterium]|nr:3-deoxy-manno-octulosonate cytidylyltransferase [Thiotrichales bacterium]